VERLWTLLREGHDWLAADFAAAAAERAAESERAAEAARAAEAIPAQEQPTGA
jgi:aromatic-L-amino-acid decarboxylase